MIVVQSTLLHIETDDSGSEFVDKSKSSYRKQDETGPARHQCEVFSPGDILPTRDSS